MSCVKPMLHTAFCGHSLSNSVDTAKSLMCSVHCVCGRYIVYVQCTLCMLPVSHLSGNCGCVGKLKTIWAWLCFVEDIQARSCFIDVQSGHFSLDACRLSWDIRIVWPSMKNWSHTATTAWHSQFRNRWPLSGVSGRKWLQGWDSEVIREVQNDNKGRRLRMRSWNVKTVRCKPQHYTYLPSYLLTYLHTYSMEQSPSWEANQ